jgi:uncharacterized protein
VAKSRKNFALYLDTSALIKLFVEEDGSVLVRKLAGGRAGAEALLSSRLGYTEAAVTLARLVHLGRLSAADLVPQLGVLERYWEKSIQEIELSELVLQDARQLAQRHPLRTYDAIHLASAREAKRLMKDIFDGEVHFLAFDTSLVRAAPQEGFIIPAV